MSEDHLSGFLNRVKHTQAEKREAASERAVRSMETGYRGQSGTFGSRLVRGGGSVGRGAARVGRATAKVGGSIGRTSTSIGYAIERTPPARNIVRQGGYVEPLFARPPRSTKQVSRDPFGFSSYGYAPSLNDPFFIGSEPRHRKKHKKKAKKGSGKSITIHLG